MKKNILFTSAVLAAALFVSCGTIKEIPEDKTSAQIIQMGQNAFASADYQSALYCYQTAIDRYGTDPSVYAEAMYEQGHLYLNQKKYDKAYKTFTELLELYDYNAAILPPAYKKLSQIGINKIPKKKLAELSKTDDE